MDWARFQQATGLFDSGRSEEALKEFRAMSALSADRTDVALLLLGEVNCLAALGNLEEARRQLRQATELGMPDLGPNIEFAEAGLCTSEGKHQDSLEKLNRLLINRADFLARTDNRYLYEEIQLRRALLLVHLQCFKDAIQLLHEALSFEVTEEDRSRIYCHLGLSYQHVEEPNQAKECFLEAQKIGVASDWEAQFHYNLGIVYYRLGSLDDSKREFLLCEQKATQDKPLLNSVYEWLSKVYSHIGDGAKAREYAGLARPC